MSIFLACYLRSKNLYSQAITLTSEVVMLLVALMFIDDTNLCVLNSGLDAVDDVAGKVQ